ncbi:MAG: 6-carboxytetrahydropterin synthase [Phycisphaeraceae bacterium]|nr:6-carboxytetrahydropterin synthase [Phycisphaeraceae bacterium]
MLEIERTVRFCLRSDGSLNAEAPIDNSFAAWPPMEELGRYYELVVVCVGQADPVTGYFLNIKTIDQAVRRDALPLVSQTVQAQTPVGRLMGQLFEALRKSLGDVVASVALVLSPTYAVRMEQDHADRLLVSQRYEFAAAHRLHAESLADEENRRVFGKCNNRHGHGHNYQLEVTVHAPADGSVPVGAAEMDRVVAEAVIDKLDHKNLDLDVPEFKQMTSSVENIARVIYRMLDQPVRDHGWGLDQVRVWETSKTVCTYRGEGVTA